MINVTHTTRSYSGKIGCMCGCLGTYNEGERARKMALNALIKNDDVTLNTWTTNSDGDAGCLWYRSNTRIRVVYLTEEGVELVKKMGIGTE